MNNLHPVIGKMHWDACKTCAHTDCIKRANYFVITLDNIICKHHSSAVFAVVGTINMKPVCDTCKIYDSFFKRCGLDTMSECEDVEFAITNEAVKCLSYEMLKKKEAICGE